MFNKMKGLARPKIKLARGTRLTSGLFIGASALVAAGILWAANMYYNIDTGTVMVEEKQQVTGTLTATTTAITVDTGNTTALTVTQKGTAAAVSVTSTASMTSDIFKITNLGTGRSFVVEDADADATPFVVDTSGNVGVATSTPSAPLAVAGNIIGSGNIILYGTTATSTFSAPIQVTRIKITEGGPAADLFLKATDSLGNTVWASVPVGIWSESGNYIYPTAISRWVGIATTTPRWRLDVADSAGFGTTTDYNTPVLLVDSLTKRVGIATSSPSATLAVTGDVMIDGDLTFVGGQTIRGSGTLTINPTGNLYLQSTSWYIDESGFLTIARVIAPELEYSGNITIDANSAGGTTVTVTNEGVGVADLSVEGDITVTGGKVTLATGETIDAETANQVTINSDGITVVRSGGTERFRVDSGGIRVTGQATTSDTLYVTSGGARITGNIIISGTTATSTFSGPIETTRVKITEGATAGWALVATDSFGNAIWQEISPATGGGWTDDGTVVRLTTITDWVGIGTTTPRYKLDIVGNAGFGTTTDYNYPLLLVNSYAGRVQVGSAGQFYIDVSGNVTTTGSIYAAGGFRTGATDATVRKSGEQIVRGVAPIFGFDLPARCNTACTNQYATFTRVIENDDDIFPSPYPGTTRKYRFSFRYADATTTANTTWQLATSSDPSYVSQFILPFTDTTDLAKGYATTTGNVTLPTTDDWFLRARLGNNGGYNLQVYEILLIGLDEVN